MSAFSRKFNKFNYYKATPLQSSTLIKLCCSLFMSRKHCDEYCKDLEMEIHPVAKTHVNQASMLVMPECIEEQTGKSYRGMDEEGH